MASASAFARDEPDIRPLYNLCLLGYPKEKIPDIRYCCLPLDGGVPVPVWKVFTARIISFHFYLKGELQTAYRSEAVALNARREGEIKELKQKKINLFESRLRYLTYEIRVLKMDKTDSTIGK